MLSPPDIALSENSVYIAEIIPRNGLLDLILASDPAHLLSTVFLLHTDLLSTFLLISSSMLFLSLSCT